MVYVLLGLWVMLWWGVLFFCLCTTTYFCVAYGPYTTYPLFFFFSYISLNFFFFSVFCMLISLSILYPYVFHHTICVLFHAWMKTFGGCGCMYIICSPIYVFGGEYTFHIFVIIVTISQDSRVRHVMF